MSGLFKSCVRCSESKSVADFYNCARRNDGLQAYCKSCTLEYRTKWIKENPEKAKAWQKGKGYEYSERERVWHRKNYLANKAKILARNKAWAAANPDAVRRLSLEGTNRRNARLRGAEGSHTRAEWVALVERCGHKCVCCGQRKKLTRDHVVPIISGGSDFIANIQPLCRECNSSKREKTIRYLEARAP